tara:strand:+ start:1250 stop:1390 length:141 start_codon:yes stop_codon:yes gene_type:complete
MGNSNSKSNKGMPRSFKCIICNKSYAMDWARNNHEKLCKEKDKNEN